VAQNMKNNPRLFKKEKNKNKKRGFFSSWLAVVLSFMLCLSITIWGNGVMSALCCMYLHIFDVRAVQLVIRDLIFSLKQDQSPLKVNLKSA
jgi:hypothetical protein